ncbi:Protein of unknown function [Pyronema omphalodes CBS 100304]|uniref:Uncharacterized protein n=1 Tax=Pyronema omphalodes (strain CBS 100304) TaxID=1076935 RepID=U4LAG2_PYROM|nr:Protein of unknown function [Pyronema omphalodes CBS 100304]
MSCTSLTDSAVGGLEFSEVVEKGLKISHSELLL